MNTPQMNRTTTSPGQVTWQVILHFVFNILMILLTLVTVVFLLTMGVGELLDLTAGMVSTTPIFLMAGGLLLCAALLLPSTFLAGMRLFNRTFVSRFRMSEKAMILVMLVAGLIVLPVVIVSGELVSRNQQISWLVLPPLHILAASIPIAWLVFLGLRGLNVGSSLRKWGVFSAGLVYAPSLIMIVEITVFIAGLFGMVMVLSSNPAWLDELLSLGQRLRFSAADPDILRRVLAPYLLQPMTIFGVFISVAVVVPLIEEMIKPAGLYFLAGKKLTPAQGLGLGLLSGAGYALFENLFLAASEVNWGVTILARAGTTGVHMLATGLMGWGLASAWSKGDFLRLGINFSLAVILHGLWNGLVILYVGLTIFPEVVILPIGSAAAQTSVLAVLVFLAVMTLVAIIGLNWRMQKKAQERESPDKSVLEITDADLLPGKAGEAVDQPGQISTDEGKDNGILTKLD